jgi:hypothetical protein
MPALRTVPNSDWRNLYVTALYEIDRSKLPGRICDAQREITARAHQLFNSPGDNIEEEQALDDALYALQALRSCLDLGTN